MKTNDFLQHATPSHELAADYAQLEQGAVIFHYPDTTPIRITGADRHDFLHGQISNDVKGLHVGQNNSALMLNHKGHALALMQVFRRDDDIFVAVANGVGALVKQQLEQHIIFDQVNLQDLSGTIDHYALQGVQALTVLQQVFSNIWTDKEVTEGDFLQVPWQDAKILIAPQRRSIQGGFDIFVLHHDAKALLEALQAQGATMVAKEIQELARVEAGNATVHNEAKGVPIPQEAGLEKYISYHKGCYLGQEIMARLEARVISQGKLRRGLARVQLSETSTELPHESPSELSPNELYSEGVKVGHISTLVWHPAGYYLALAILKKNIDSLDASDIWEWL